MVHLLLLLFLLCVLNLSQLLHLSAEAATPHSSASSSTTRKWNKEGLHHMVQVEPWRPTTDMVAGKKQPYDSLSFRLHNSRVETGKEEVVTVLSHYSIGGLTWGQESSTYSPVGKCIFNVQ